MIFFLISTYKSYSSLHSKNLGKGISFQYTYKGKILYLNALLHQQKVYRMSPIWYCVHIYVIEHLLFSMLLERVYTVDTFFDVMCGGYRNAKCILCVSSQLLLIHHGNRWCSLNWVLFQSIFEPFLVKQLCLYCIVL